MSCFAAAISIAVITAQAGTTRSGGGHGMVNARNYSATRNLSGRNIGGHFGGFSRAHSYLQKAISNFKAQKSGSNLKSVAPIQHNLTSKG